MAQGAASLIGSTVARTAEVLLAVAGLGYTIFGSEKDTDEALFGTRWTLVALGYLTVGGLRVRAQRFAPQDRPGPGVPSWSRGRSVARRVVRADTRLRHGWRVPELPGSDPRR
jgi:hypothetical protein